MRKPTKARTRAPPTRSGSRGTVGPALGRGRGLAPGRWLAREPDLDRDLVLVAMVGSSGPRKDAPGQLIEYALPFSVPAGDSDCPGPNPWEGGLALAGLRDPVHRPARPG